MAHVASGHATAFSSFDLRTGCLFDDSVSEFPTVLSAWSDGSKLALENAGADALFGTSTQGRPASGPSTIPIAWSRDSISAFPSAWK